MNDLRLLNKKTLIYKIDHNNPKLLIEIDKHLAEKINSMQDVYPIYNLLVRTSRGIYMPNVQNKISDVFMESIKKGNLTIDAIVRYCSWLNSKTQYKVLNIWLDEKNVSYEYITNCWMTNFETSNDEVKLKVLSKLIEIYKEYKSRKNMNLIEKIFNGFDEENVEGACKILANSSSSVASLLLQRSDIPNEFIIKGLRALSKVSQPREIKGKFDLENLKYLGPKARLKVMKHLMGINCPYYQFKKERKENPNDRYYLSADRTHRLQRRALRVSFPFKEIPKREDLELFLFPCTMHYNEDVIEILERFDTLKNKQISKEKANAYI